MSKSNYPDEDVTIVLDRIIKEVEHMVTEMNRKDEELALKDKEILLRDQKIRELTQELDKSKEWQHKLQNYKNMESTLKKNIELAEKNTIQMQENAKKESEMILEEARKNADRIVNESLIRAEKTEMEANMLKRNIAMFKSRVKNMIDSQLEIVEDIEKVDI